MSLELNMFLFSVLVSQTALVYSDVSDENGHILNVFPSSDFLTRYHSTTL